MMRRCTARRATWKTCCNTGPTRGRLMITVQPRCIWHVGGGSLIIARQLLDVGADINASNESGTTPMHEAASSGQADVVQMLLDRGARARVRDVRDYSPAQVAKTHGHFELFEALTAVQSR